MVGDDGEQSICRRYQPNSLTVLNDSKELFPISSHLGRTSLPIKRTRGEEHGEAEPAREPSDCQTRAHGTIHVALFS
jgi:hypothetical protein